MVIAILKFRSVPSLKDCMFVKIESVTPNIVSSVSSSYYRFYSTSTLIIVHLELT